MFEKDDKILKGIPPSYEDETLYEKYRWFCQQYHWDKSQTWKATSDLDGDGHVKPSPKLFLYNLCKKTWNWNPLWRFRQWCQAKFRKNGLSDSMVWDALSSMAKYNLKVLKAFRESERSGYPSVFEGYSAGGRWRSVQRYDKQLDDGEIQGEGMDAWNRILDHIIMSLEYVVNEGDSKWEEKWFMKWFGMAPHDEANECNKYITYSYKMINEKKGIASTMSSKMPNLDEVEWCTESISFHNTELVFYAEEVVNYGLELLGKYFRNFWD